MSALDELLSRWRSNPDADATIALCSYLGASKREELIREVGLQAETWHRDENDVMLAVGRMYLDADMLAESQAALVVAGKANPADARSFRFLGEVLLRRGDALRAEKVLARAMQLGSNDADSRLWHDRAVVFVGLQKRVGVQAVAAEVARTLPKQLSIPPPTADTGFDDEEVVTEPRMKQPAIPGPPALPGGAPSPGSPVVVSGPPPAPAVAASAPLPPAPAVAPVPASPAVVAPPEAPAASPGPVASAPAGLGVVHIDHSPSPDARAVLDGLATVGIFEPAGGAAPAWEAAPRTRSRGTWVFVIATVLVAGAAVGGYAYARKVKAERIALAARMMDETEAMLDTGKLPEIQATDEKLSQIFELDSRSQRAAKLWLQNRVLHALMVPGESRGIDAAVHRALSIDVPEEEIVFGRVVSFMVDGDLAGGAALLPKWDEKASKDPYYQLAAGAVLERAGDVEKAIERYEAALGLDSSLLAAEVLLAQLAIVELGAERSAKTVESVKKKLGDRPAAKALSALSWAAPPDRPADPPADARLSDEEKKLLPVAVRPAPHVVDALVALRDGKRDTAVENIETAIGLSMSPAMATWVGFLALEAADEKLARTAALRALQFAAVYPRARVLASRVALLGGRLDEAMSAIEQLDPTSQEVAVVRAVAAYETLDVSELESAVDALGDVEGRASFAALAAAPAVARGGELPEPEALAAMAEPSVPWGELVAVDAALDTGNLELAAKLVGDWGKAADRPVFQIRAARLKRYQGEGAEAAKAAVDALNHGTVTPRALVEGIFSLIASEDTKIARDVTAKFPTVLGPMTRWLRVLIDAKSGNLADANFKAAQLELPHEASPLLFRVLAARSLAAAGDKRAGPWVKDLAKQAGGHPDVKAALEDL